MSEWLDFALKPGAKRGDSAFLLNSGRHRLAFDPFPGRAIVLAFLGSIADPAAESALMALSANRRLADEGKAAFFAVARRIRFRAGDRASSPISFDHFLMGGRRDGARLRRRPILCHPRPDAADRRHRPPGRGRSGAGAI